MKTARNATTDPFFVPASILAESTHSEQRAEAYEFLAGIFLREPSVEAFTELKVWAKASGDEVIQSILREIASDDPLLGNLQQEFYDLFFVPVSGRFVPPFESAISDALRNDAKKTKFGSFWGPETIKVAALYDRAAFHPNQLAIFEPLRTINLPDHIGFELSFMSYLCRIEEKQKKDDSSSTGIRQLQKSMLIEHLNRWLPLFIQDLEQEEHTGYYSYFAKLAQTVCEEEASLLIGEEEFD